MTRIEEIRQKAYEVEAPNYFKYKGFVEGAQWADENRIGCDNEAYNRAYDDGTQAIKVLICLYLNSHKPKAISDDDWESYIEQFRKEMINDGRRTGEGTEETPQVG